MIHHSDSASPHERTSLIGIAVAIGGNILISLALNCQKLAHKRLEEEHQISNDHQPDEERQPLVRSSPGTNTLANYGSNMDSTSPLSVTTVTERRYVTNGSGTPSEEELVDETRYRSAHYNKSSPSLDGQPTEDESRKGNETDYLRSKLWWSGFLLMNIGECGNFLSYAYAPASVVAPLGTVALIANCFFAPLMLKETLRKQDILGIALSVIGAITVVGAGKSKEVQLDVDGLIEAISRRVFIVYAVICLTLVFGLSALSASRAGKRWIFVDVGLCAVFGGFTVLSTKALSTFISLYWINIFKYWITYCVIGVLLFTGIGQVLYLNRALRNFDSKIVIPTFFISFNLSAIVGSAILYEEFQNVSVHQLTTFFYGCLATFLGVYFLSRSTTDAASTLEEPVQSDEARLEAAEPAPAPEHARYSVASSRQILQNRTSLVLSASQYLLIASSPIRESAEWTSSAIRTTTSVITTPAKLPPTSQSNV